MSADYFRRLFEYNSWANARVFDCAAKVTERGYLAEREGLSFGSLHATLVHIVMGEATWLARWREGPTAPGLGNARDAATTARDEITTLDEVRRAWSKYDAGLRTYVDALTDADLDRPMTYRLPNGLEYTDELAFQLGHIANHSTQFRAEAAVRLTELGVSPGDIDFTVVLRNLHGR